jgi:hypothetical protein
MATTNLTDVSGPDTVEILPGLIFEDRLRIRTQRRLEKHFDRPMYKIFPGKKEPPGKEAIVWEGVDFSLLDNLIPLLTILGQQVNHKLVEADVENLLDDVDDPSILLAKFQEYFIAMKARSSSTRKNIDMPSPHVTEEQKIDLEDEN